MEAEIEGVHIALDTHVKKANVNIGVHNYSVAISKDTAVEIEDRNKHRHLPSPTPQPTEQPPYMPSLMPSKLFNSDMIALEAFCEGVLALFKPIVHFLELYKRCQWALYSRCP